MNLMDEIDPPSMPPRCAQSAARGSDPLSIDAWDRNGMQCGLEEDNDLVSQIMESYGAVCEEDAEMEVTRAGGESFG